jgi:DNA repair exonuclease SbcCD ATPase subunit
MAADEIVMTVKSNLSQVAAETKTWETSLKGAAKEVEELTEDVKVQNQVLIDAEKELIKLEAAQAKIGKGAWDPSNLTKKIAEQKAAIKDERNGLKNLNNQLKNAKGESKKFTQAQKDQEKAMKGSIGQFSIMGVSLNGIKSAFGKIGPAAKIMFGTIKAGIASTGIGVLLIAFGALVTHFTSSKKAMDKLKVAIAQVSAAINVIKDRIAQFGGAIMKVFKGDFKGAAADMKASISGIGEEMKKEVKQAKELQIATNNLRDANNDFIIMEAKKKQAIAEARLLAKDETLSQEERVEALQNVINQENALLDVQLRNQAEKVRIMQEQFDMGLSTAEDEKELAMAKVEYINMETASMNQKRTLMREMNTLNAEIQAEELARLKELEDEKKRIAEEAEEARIKLEEEEAERKAIKAEEDLILKELEEENMLAAIEDLRERALMEIEIEYQKELTKYENAANFAQIKEQLDIKYANAKKELDKKELKWSEITTKQKLDMAKGAFDNLAQMLGKESKAGKAAAIASATISTYQGATSAFASLAPIPFVGPVLGGIAAAAAIVAGFKNIQAIRKGSTSTPSTPPPPSTSGGGGGPDIPTPEEPAAEMMGGAFELGNVGNEPDPVKAFVVTDEMTDSQDQLQDIRNRSTI